MRSPIMPIVPYYLGRPRSLWINAMSRKEHTPRNGTPENCAAPGRTGHDNGTALALSAGPTAMDGAGNASFMAEPLALLDSGRVKT
jgi:hypothetical protein